MHYTLHQLQIFLKITQTRSITKAAEELHLTQPAVSIQLKNLQDQFEIPLTEVIGRQLYVTDFGAEIATAVEKILGEVYAGDSDEPDHPIPAQADHQFRGKLTRGFRWKLTTLNV
jgi:DNA-binding transcriptional LysR family regulator